jgi:hypothetical protein
MRLTQGWLVIEVKDRDSMPWQAQNGVDIVCDSPSDKKYSKPALDALRTNVEASGYKYYFDLGWRRGGANIWRRDWLLSNGVEHDEAA